MFSTWLEARQFRNLIPQEILALVPKLKNEAQALNQLYYQDHTKVPSQKEFTRIPDPFRPGRDIPIVFIKRDNKTKGQGGFRYEGDEKVILYSIPMTGFDTIYHELVHAHDPKLAKGISKSIMSNGMQNNTTPHEIDAYIGGHVDRIKDNLAHNPQREALLTELKNWLRNTKSEADLEPHNLPQLLQGMMLYHIIADKKNWRRFVSILNNELF